MGYGYAPGAYGQQQQYPAFQSTPSMAAYPQFNPYQQQPAPYQQQQQPAAAPAGPAAPRPVGKKTRDVKVQKKKKRMCC